MKKVLCVLLVIVFCFSLIGCDEDYSPSGNLYTEGEIKISYTCSDFRGKKYQIVERQLKDLGFQNIELFPITDLVIGFFTENGEIEKVTINGHEDYSKDSTFAADCKIVIYYHTFPSSGSNSTKETDYSEGNIKISSTSNTFKGNNYQTVQKQLTDLGFQNIEFSQITDLIIGFLTSDGEVEKVTINGHEDYSANSTFAPNAKIIVYYHTFSPSGSNDGQNGGGNSGTQQTQKKNKIGDAVTVGNFEYTIISVSTAKKVGSSSYHQIKTSGTFVLIEIKVKNIGSKQETLYESDMKLIHSGNEYEIHDDSWYWDGCFSMLANIGAKMEDSYILLYELPEDYSENDYLQVRGPSLWDGKADIYLSNK